MAVTRCSKQCQNSSVFNIQAKVLKSLQDLQLNEREFQTAGALTLKALAANVNDMGSTVSNSLSAILDSVQGYSHGLSETGRLE